MVTQSATAMSTAPAIALTRPAWVRDRIAEMGASWGTAAPRVAGTLWWCMVASALVEQIVAARAAGRPAPPAGLEALDCEMRPDGGVERMLAHPERDVRMSVGGDADLVAALSLRETLTRVIPVVAQVSGAGMPALWAVVADAIGNRAIDVGAPQVATGLAEQVGGKLPRPRFVEAGGRTFVRRISCCLVFEVPGAAMCTSCPKRSSDERAALLASYAAGR